MRFKWNQSFANNFTYIFCVYIVVHKKAFNPMLNSEMILVDDETKTLTLNKLMIQKKMYSIYFKSGLNTQ